MSGLSGATARREKGGTNATMSGGQIDYGGMMQRALRGVLSQALGMVAEQGPIGAHHFYIKFDTTHAGVTMPDWLKEQFPEEITIVLQHEFWDLAVTPDRFTVTLSFSDRSATMTVPFDAVLQFVDPHAEFGLKFDGHEVEDEEEAPVPEADFEPEPEPDPDGPPRGGGEVVSIDSFRKH